MDRATRAVQAFAAEFDEAFAALDHAIDRDPMCVFATPLLVVTAVEALIAAVTAARSASPREPLHPRV